MDFLETTFLGNVIDIILLSIKTLNILKVPTWIEKATMPNNNLNFRIYIPGVPN